MLHNYFYIFYLYYLTKLLLLKGKNTPSGRALLYVIVTNLVTVTKSVTLLRGNHRKGLGKSRGLKP